MDWVADGAGWKAAPDNKLYVIDLTASPPRLIDTVAVGKQPSGMSINRAGNLALIANRADNSISVLASRAKKSSWSTPWSSASTSRTWRSRPTASARLPPSSPGTRWRCSRSTARRSPTPSATSRWACGRTTSTSRPTASLALTADNGNAGGSDGNIDTVSVIDLEAKPERVIDKVVVGDAPEGFAISPNGKLAVAVLLRGSNNAKTELFYNRNGSVVVLKIDGKKVTKVGEVEVRGLPEGAVFSPDGRWLYVGNYMDEDISVLRVDGETVTNTGTAGQACRASRRRCAGERSKALQRDRRASY